MEKPYSTYAVTKCRTMMVITSDICFATVTLPHPRERWMLLHRKYKRWQHVNARTPHFRLTTYYKNFI
jgi:hypothetical protein